jgi:MFS family permease
MSVAVAASVGGLLGWWSSGSIQARRALVAATLGWMLDAFDVTLFAMTLPAVRASLGLSATAAGVLGSVTLVAGAAGGLVFGWIADRFGRTRALMLSVIVYSVFTAACGLALDFWQLVVFRVLLGFGMGGEWASGAALVSESWGAEHRGKALGLMQSSWAIGEIVAAAVVGVVLPRFGWRAVFFVGILPALLVFWIRRDVPESAVWLEKRGRRDARRVLLRPDVRRNGLLATAMNALSMFGYWGLFTWIPAYLALPASQGGRGLGLFATTTWLIVMGVGKWLGYVLFGFAADAFGRRRSYVTYLLVAAALVPLYGLATSPTSLLVLGPLVAFFGTGYFSGFSALTAELFPTEVRATAMGVSYNIGRGLSAAAPFVVGALANTYGLGSAFFLQAAAFFLAALLALALPETRGKVLE